MSVTLNKQRLAQAANAIALLDEDMARILAVHGTPPLWAREPGFITLLRIILEQQVSLASADAMYRRLALTILNHLTPYSIIDAGAPFLRSLGITRQKAARISLTLPRPFKTVIWSLKPLGKESDDSVIEKLTSIKGHWPHGQRRSTC